MAAQLAVGPLRIPQGSLPLRVGLVEDVEGGSQGSLPLWLALGRLDCAQRAEEDDVGNDRNRA